MFYRRSPFRLIVLIGLGVLVGMMLTGGAEAIAGVAMIPFLILAFAFKVLLIFMIFGFIFGGMKRHHRRHNGSWPESDRWSDWMDEASSRRRRRKPEPKPEKPQTETFEDWHRMAHARREVDDHAPPVDD